MAQIVDINTEEFGTFPKRVVTNIVFVNKEDVLAECSSVTIKSPFSGIFVPNWIDFPGNSKLLGVVSATKKEAFSTLFYTNPNIEQDPFTNTKKIAWKGKPRVEFSPLSCYDGCVFRLSKQLFFSFEYYDDKGIIVFKADDRLKLSKNDRISILFENGKILDFRVQEKPIKGSFFSTISCTLYEDDIDLFLQSRMVSFRLTFNKEGKSPVTENCGSFYGQYLFEAIVSYIDYYLGVLKELLPDYHLPRRIVDNTTVDYRFNWCYVYLMRDNTNGYHKIGISNKPEYREKTLQSEKPSIEMLACKKFPTRKIAEAIESALHTAYSQQRIRGEWFNLDDEDVAAIIETLK